MLKIIVSPLRVFVAQIAVAMANSDGRANVLAARAHATEVVALVNSAGEEVDFPVTRPLGSL